MGVVQRVDFGAIAGAREPRLSPKILSHGYVACQSFSSPQHRLLNCQCEISIVRWHRIAVVLSPPIGSIKIILALFWINIRSVSDVLQKRQPIFFWHVSRRYSFKWMS